MDNLHKKKRGANITSEQKTLLIEYMNKHPELVKGKLTSSFTLKDSIRLWNEISEIFNSINGAKKEWKDWRKCWHDFQSRIKKKHILIKQSRATTGGGEQNAEVLTEQEEQVLNIMSSTSIYGHPDVEESNINILIDSEDDMQVEFLHEYENVMINSNEQNKIPFQKKQIDTSIHSDSNNCNILMLQKRKAVIENELSNEKENINRTRNNDIENQSSSKADKALEDIGTSLNTNYLEQDKTS
ncbi:PREDICTED: uncharacterized protein LOC108766768, partial [Trachymyrmex cornetzi]|uniref:uncharacterized protein LOC108766768 n=1 Tax=Trachymyrmex cornetzi TaxID=471704 RepID=UPI00084F1955